MGNQFHDAGTVISACDFATGAVLPPTGDVGSDGTDGVVVPDAEMVICISSEAVPPLLSVTVTLNTYAPVVHPVTFDLPVSIGVIVHAGPLTFVQVYFVIHPSLSVEGLPLSTGNQFHDAGTTWSLPALATGSALPGAGVGEGTGSGSGAGVGAGAGGAEAVPPL